jgi:hypothetical protein
MRKYLVYEVLGLALLFIAWVLGAVSLARFGELLMALGVLFSIIVVLSLLGVHIFTGDVSEFLPLNKVIALESIKSMPRIAYILAALGLGIIPIVIGVILLLIS